MDSLHEKFHWKVWVLILIVLFIFILFLILLPILFSQQTSKRVGTNTIPGQAERSVTVGDNPNGASTIPQARVPIITPTTNSKGENTQPLSQILVTPFFNLRYPSGWSASEKTLSTGNAWILQTNQGSQIIEIQVYQSNVVSLQTLANVFATLRYTQAPILVSGTNGIRFQGSILGSNQNLYETAVIFQRNDRVFKFQSSYSAKSRNQTFEDTVGAIIASMTLK